MTLRFLVDQKVFEIAPSYCVGIVVARGVKNGPSSERIGAMLAEAVAERRSQLPPSPAQVKALPQIACWRTAFQKAGINPNKFPPSIEAILLRLAKGGELPSINSVVDLCNLISVKYVLPVGAHDIGKMSGDFAVRPSKEGEPFSPMGTSQRELVPAGEVVYADALEVRTRRWTWRQGENAKITDSSTWVFCPIDGFTDVNRSEVLRARDELASMFAEVLGVKPSVYWVDAAQPLVELG
ncbi:MAG: B3/4 domain-containing protein [Bacillota bacterium]